MFGNYTVVLGGGRILVCVHRVGLLHVWYGSRLCRRFFRTWISWRFAGKEKQEMTKAEELRNAAATIKAYCDNMKCRRHEKCLFYRDRNYLGGCMMAHAPMYWQEKALKTRKEVFLEYFPNAPLDEIGKPYLCVNNAFGAIQEDCRDRITHCGECWDLPAPEEYQEELE